jgi:hypothetical protein
MDRSSEKQSDGEFLAEGLIMKSYLFYHEVGDVHALGPVRQPLAGQPGLRGRKLIQDLVPDRADQHVTATVDVHVFQLRALDQQPF